MALCIEAGFIDGETINDSVGFPATTIAIKLTWAGHELLDAARNQTIWNKAEARIKKIRR